jgi:CRP/FNR family cyclic AMP-dependent transcriptional regulator
VRQDLSVEEYAPDTFLAALAEGDLEAIRASGRQRSFRRGAYLLHEGDRASTVLFLLGGMVKLTKAGSSGRETVLEVRVAGDVMGELGAIDGRPRSASVVAISDVDALAVSADRFVGLIHERAGIASKLLIVVIHRLRRASDRQFELGGSDAIKRVCARLVELAASHGVEDGAGVRVALGISQHELAEWCGVSRDGVVRALHELRTSGLVDTGRRSVLLRDVAAVRARARLLG